MKSALSDLLVLDLSRVLAGPYATMLLGDLGARVIKVEQPGTGDDTRRWGPPFTANGESAYFFSANRNKESLTLDLKHPRGRAILLDLVARADVLVENFKVGTMDRMGLGFASLHEVNPRLIFCAVTGYGQTGPDRDRPGYDTAMQAQGGIMSVTGPRAGGREQGAGGKRQGAGFDVSSAEQGKEQETGGKPYKVGVAITDIATGLHANIAILAALHHRQQSGEGQYIDIALFDTQLSWLANVASAYLVSGETPKRYGNAHAAIVPYQTMPTSDGWVMLAVGNDGQFAALCRALGCPELARDERFVTNQQRVRHRDALIPLLEHYFRAQPSSHWVSTLPATNVPCSPVNDIPTALADPQAQARNMVQMIEHPVTGRIPMLGPVPKFSATPATIRLPPPLLGEQTVAILHEFLGYDEQMITELRSERVI